MLVWEEGLLEELKGLIVCVVMIGREDDTVWILDPVCGFTVMASYNRLVSINGGIRVGLSGWFKGWLKFEKVWCCPK